MKIVLLCGGKGTRLGFETKILPKPMVKLDKDPIIIHIINYYKKFGYKDFILALGYKGKIIKNYFKKKKLSVLNQLCGYRCQYTYRRQAVKTKKIPY